MRTGNPKGLDGWQMAVGAYAACQALALWTTPAIFQQEAFTVMRVFPVTPNLLAAVLAAYAVASVTCMFAGKPTKRAALGIVGIAMWFFLGTMMMMGTSLAGQFLSPSGMFEVICSLGCGVSVRQWARIE